MRIFLPLKLIIAVAAFSIIALTVFFLMQPKHEALPPPSLVPPAPFFSVPKKIGIAIFEVPPAVSVLAGFKSGLEARGYHEGAEVTYEEHIIPRGENEHMRLAEIIREYSSKNIDLILVFSGETKTAVTIVEDSGKTTPVVFLNGNEAMLRREGIITEVQSERENVTGLVNNVSEIAGKQLEFLKQIKPDVASIGVLSTGYIIPDSPAPLFLAELNSHASSRFGIVVHEYTTSVMPNGAVLEAEMRRTLDGIRPGDVDAWFHLPGHYLPQQQVFEAEFGKRLKIPVIMPATTEVEAEVGGLLSYSADFHEIGVQVADIVDKIFKGALPSSIPIETPLKYELAVNLNTARTIGIIIPHSVLSLADKIIE